MPNKNYDTKNQEPVAYSADCWEGCRIVEPIREYREDTGKTEIIGHLWFCLRRFLRPGPEGKILSPRESVDYQHVNCQTCRAEITLWGKHVRVDFSKTKYSKSFFQNFIRDCLERKARNFTVNAESIPIPPDIQEIQDRIDKYHADIPAPHPYIPESFGSVPPEYNPDLFTESKEGLL